MVLTCRDSSRDLLSAGDRLDFHLNSHWHSDTGTAPVSLMAHHPNKSSRVPVEIAERIIDFLANDDESLDKQSLFACALTCSSWLPRSRYHLFHDVQIFNSRQLNSLRWALDSAPGLKYHIRELHLFTSQPLATPVAPSRRLLSAETDAPNPDIIVSALTVLAAYAIQIHRLKIEWGSVLEPLTSSFHLRLPVLGAVHQYSNVRELALSSVVYQSSSDLARFLLAFPSLRNLATQKIDVKSPLPPSRWLQARLQSRLQLTSMWVGHGETPIPCSNTR